MRKIIKGLCYIIGFPFLFAFFCYEMIVVSIECLRSHDWSISEKSVIVGFYVGVGLLFFYNKIICLSVVLGIVTLLIILVVVNGQKKKGNAQENNWSGESEEHSKVNEKRRNNDYFYGMSMEEAKSEYRKLMKKYHPDNTGGDLEMTQMITVAYRKYCDAIKK